MKLLNILKETIKKADFFQTRDLLRYKAESEYKTTFGGAISLLLIALLISIFYDRIISCIQKEQINAVEQTLVRGIPTPYQIKAYPADNFMMAISLRHFTIADINKYFEVTMDQLISIWDYPGDKWNNTVNKVALEPCTRAHWKLLPRMDFEYDSWGLGDMFCIPMGSVFDLEGDEMSDTSKRLKILISPCVNGSQQGKVCADKSEIDQMFKNRQKIQARIYIVNSNVNPSTQQYIEYNFNYRNMLTFTNKDSAQGTIYVKDYQISTDESILPIPSQKTDTGATFSTTIIQKTFLRPNETSPYCEFFIYKSENSLKYIRTFSKLDQNLAFLGGLFGMLSMILIFVEHYNNNAYEICLGATLFKPQDDHELSTFRNYNFFSYLLQLIHQTLGTVGISPEWKSTIEYIKCQKQMEQQLDVQYLLNRIHHLETASEALLEEDQIKGLHLKGKITLKEARRKRKIFKLKKQARAAEKSMNKLNNNLNSDNNDLSSNCLDLNKCSVKNDDGIATGDPPLPQAPNPFEFFMKNKVSFNFPPPQQQESSENDHQKRKKTLKFRQNPIVQSDSESDNESLSNLSNRSGNEVMGILNRLRRDSDKLSKKIWKLTNVALLNTIPDLLFRENGILGNLIGDTINTNENGLGRTETQIKTEHERELRFSGNNSQIVFTEQDLLQAREAQLPEPKTPQLKPKRKIIRPSRLLKPIERISGDSQERKKKIVQRLKEKGHQSTLIKKRYRQFRRIEQVAEHSATTTDRNSIQRNS